MTKIEEITNKLTPVLSMANDTVDREQFFIMSNRDYSNRATNKQGDVGEVAFYNFLKSRGLDAQLTANDMILGMNWGVDIWSNDKWGFYTTYDVKCTNTIKGIYNSIVIEVSDNLMTQHEGWLYHSKCDYFVFIDNSDLDTFYIAKRKNLIEYVERHEGERHGGNTYNIRAYWERSGICRGLVYCSVEHMIAEGVLIVV